MSRPLTASDRVFLGTALQTIVEEQTGITDELPLGSMREVARKLQGPVPLFDEELKTAFLALHMIGQRVATRLTVNVPDTITRKVGFATAQLAKNREANPGMRERPVINLDGGSDPLIPRIQLTREEARFLYVVASVYFDHSPAVHYDEVENAHAYHHSSNPIVRYSLLHSLHAAMSDPAALVEIDFSFITRLNDWLKDSNYWYKRYSDLKQFANDRQYIPPFLRRDPQNHLFRAIQLRHE